VKRRFASRLVDPFPAVGGNAIVATDHGPTFFEGMLAAIRAARATVDVEMYLWDDDEVGRSFVDALRDAALRGVRVRVIVDAVGAAEVVSRLDSVDEAGGDVRVFSPFRFRFFRRYFHRTHKKLLITDSALAFTGGAGFSLHWTSGARREEPWHDRMFEIRGPVVRQLERVFETDFQRWPARRERAAVERPDATLDLTSAGISNLRVLRGWPDARDFRTTLVQQVAAARERIWIGTPYFFPPPSLLRALTAAMKRGVDVRFVFPSGNYAHPLLWHAMRRHYRWFLKRGAKVHEYSRGFYHVKIAIIDRTAAIVGSSNLDYWSWSRNAEIDIVATDAETADALAACFEADRACARAVSTSDVGLASWWSRMKQRAAGWVERWL